MLINRKQTMKDIVRRLRSMGSTEWLESGDGIVAVCCDAAAEIERLRLWVRRIENINDDPARFSTEIDHACIEALAGKPMTGLVNAYQQKTRSGE